jgi:hypothetical protein
MSFLAHNWRLPPRRGDTPSRLTPQPLARGIAAHLPLEFGGADPTFRLAQFRPSISGNPAVVSPGL